MIELGEMNRLRLKIQPVTEYYQRVFLLCLDCQQRRKATNILNFYNPFLLLSRAFLDARSNARTACFTLSCCLVLIALEKKKRNYEKFIDNPQKKITHADTSDKNCVFA